MQSILSHKIKEPLTHVFGSIEQYYAVNNGIFRLSPKTRHDVMKPQSFWISMNHDWERWCGAENFRKTDKPLISEVTLKDGLKFLKIITVKDAEDLAEFVGLKDKHHNYDFGGKDFSFRCGPADMISLSEYMLGKLRGEVPPDHYLWQPLLDKYDGIYFLNSWQLHGETFFNSWDADSIALFRPFGNVTFSDPRLTKQVIDINQA